MKSIKVIVETGKKRTFASALDWPGWSRSGKNEESAMKALVDYGLRYAQILGHTQLDFLPPTNGSKLVIIERLKGNTTTDFGAPDFPAEVEKKSISKKELERYKVLLLAYWQAFDRAVQRAEGKELRKGPRGGGRDLEKIMGHVVGADQGYLRQIAWKPKQVEGLSLKAVIKQTREEILSALEHAVMEGLPEQGPRGGKIWPARYYVRRMAWHLLDHAWEIEDRM